MKNATPKEEELEVPKNKEERLGELKLLGLGFLEKTKKFLEQLDYSGMGDIDISMKEIKGVKSEDIQKMLFDINSIYANHFDFDSPINKERAKIDAKGKLIFDDDTHGNRVFSLGKPDIVNNINSTSHIERTFRKEQSFELALKEIEEVINKEKETKTKYITKRNNIFYFNNIPIELNTNAKTYQVLFSIYEITKGDSKIIKIKDIIRCLKRFYPKDYKGKSDKVIEKMIRGCILEKDKGLKRKIEYNLQNGSKIFSSIRNEGIQFNNEQI